MAEKVDQDVRDARRWMGKLPRDQFDLLLLLMREREVAGRQQGLREAAEVAMRLHALPRLAPADAYDELPRIEGAITYDPQDVDCYDATARRIANAITALIEGEGH